MDSFSEDAVDEFPPPTNSNSNATLVPSSSLPGASTHPGNEDSLDLDEELDEGEDDSLLQEANFAQQEEEEDIDDLEDLDDDDSMDMSELPSAADTDLNNTTSQLSEYDSDEEDDDEDDDDDDDDDESGEDDDEEEEGSAEDSSAAQPSIVMRIKSAASNSSSRSATGSPASMEATPVKRRPGRPSKAEMARRIKERGDAPPEEDKPKPKRGRKPRSEEEKAKIKEEQKAKRKEAREAKRAKLRAEKAALKADKKMKKKGVGRGRGRKAKVLTQEDLDAKEEIRKAKYEEFKRGKLEAKAKRLERNEALRIFRKKKKEEDKRQREAFEKRMQNLKATFLDENSHLSGGTGVPTEGGLPEGGLDETSQSSVTRGTGTAHRWSLGNEVARLHLITDVTAGNLFEYRWPPGSKTAEHYFLQEQVTEYLGIKSFKRKYPTTTRRPVESEERDFLVEMRVVNITQADLGLTALPSTQVLDIMSNDFYEKYDEYMTVVSDRKDRTMRTTSYNTVKSTDNDFVDKSSRAAAEWNKRMNADIRENRASYFDMQTFHIHYPQRNKGRMRVVQKPKPGHYPVALIPGQFVDYYRTFTSTQLSYLPLNTTLKAPPPPGARLSELDSDGREGDDVPITSDESESDSDSGSSSGSSSDDSSSSGSDSDSDVEEAPAPPVVEPEKPKRAIDAEVPGAMCRICNGDRLRNKIGTPEKLLHCSKCSSSCHPTCAGLTLELLTYVTSYNWECTECKICTKCEDHTDEDKMLFCDLCDRGYHNYCVGLHDIPSGRWHCRECTECVSCKVRDPVGVDAQNSEHRWMYEYKTNPMGNKIFSHTMCKPCHRAWKRTQFCPECNVCYGRESNSLTVEYHACMVCSRQHHAACVGQAIFICAACQAKTLSKTIGSAFSRGFPSMSAATDEAAAPPAKRRPSTPERQQQYPPKPSPNKYQRPGNDSGPQTCELCDKVYKNKSTLYAHKNRDHGLKAAQQNQQRMPRVE